MSVRLFPVCSLRPAGCPVVQVLMCGNRVIPHNKNVLRIRTVCSPGVIKRSHLCVATVSDDHFVVKNFVRTDCSYRDASPSQQVHCRPAGVVVLSDIGFPVQHHSHINTATFCADKGADHLRRGEGIAHQTDFLLRGLNCLKNKLESCTFRRESCLNGGRVSIRYWRAQNQTEQAGQKPSAHMFFSEKRRKPSPNAGGDIRRKACRALKINQVLTDSERRL